MSGTCAAALTRRSPARLLAAALAALAACSEERGNFSQEPGFAAWYAAHPPSTALPTAAERALLERYRPRVWLPEGHEGPIDFYRDYIAQGELRDGGGALISAAVTPEVLNGWKSDPAVVFEHEPGSAAPRPRIYGRIERGELELPGCAAALPVTFLTYNLVFRHSGLPMGLPGWQAALLAPVADLDDWHQLDHYTALTLALAADGAGDLAPFAATFQQHNYLRTYLLADEDRPGRLALPPDGRIAVDIALRSNELYPHRPGHVRRRAVSFMTPEAARYLIEGSDPPWRAADDVTMPAREIEPELAFLPPADAFYIFQGWLGERRALPGRDGPPGADYNTLPPFKPKALQLALFYWAEEQPDYLTLLDGPFARGRPRDLAPAPFTERLARDLPPRLARAACAGPAGA
jgi:hypothetical protein